MLKSIIVPCWPRPPFTSCSPSHKPTPRGKATWCSLGKKGVCVWLELLMLHHSYWKKKRKQKKRKFCFWSLFLWRYNQKYDPRVLTECCLLMPWNVWRHDLSHDFCSFLQQVFLLWSSNNRQWDASSMFQAHSRPSIIIQQGFWFLILFKNIQLFLCYTVNTLSAQSEPFWMAGPETWEGIFPTVLPVSSSTTVFYLGHIPIARLQRKIPGQICCACFSILLNIPAL